MINDWLTLPVVPMLVTLVLFFGAIASLLVYLSFGRWTGRAIQSCRGVVAPFVGTVAVILAILLGFLANDIWDRERRAAAAVRAEADSLLSVMALAATFDLPRQPLAGAVRHYAKAVVTREWPSMAEGDAAPAAEFALDQLLKTIARLDLSAVGNGDLRRLLLDAGLAVRTARNQRLYLSRDESETAKWLMVLVLAVMSQVTVAVVHLDAKRAQMTALTIWTLGLVLVIGLLVVHDEPFNAPLIVSPNPIIHVLQVLDRPSLAGATQKPAPADPAKGAKR